MHRIARLLVPVWLCLASGGRSGLAWAEGADSPLTAVAQTFAELERNPGDDALREKLIKFSLKMNPPPVESPAATAHRQAAKLAFAQARTEADFAAAAEEFERALALAPWVAANYYRCGVAREQAGQFDAAIRNFRLCLMAAPDAPDAAPVRRRIAAAQAAADELARRCTASAQTPAAGAHSLAGTWGLQRSWGGVYAGYLIIEQSRGVWKVSPQVGRQYTYDVVQRDRNISFARAERTGDGIYTDYFVLTLSPDGTQLTGTRKSAAKTAEGHRWITHDVELVRQ